MTQKPAMYHADCGGRISNETMHCDKCQQQVNDSSQWVQPTATEEMQAAEASGLTRSLFSEKGE